MYCYHVAGVVGVMMCYIMNVRSDVAHMHAIAFGNALQLTNIIRDIREDWNMGRIYVPQEWLKEEDIDEANFDLAIAKWPALARRLSLAADARYKFGREGLHFLPWRCRLACRIAGSVYQQISIKAERLGVHAWDDRVVVSFTVKVIYALKEISSQGAAALWSWLRRRR
jgi:phytoene synthase